jgi:hypothetical protein
VADDYISFFTSPIVYTSNVQKVLTPYPLKLSEGAQSLCQAGKRRSWMHQRKLQTPQGMNTGAALFVTMVPTFQKKLQSRIEDAIYDEN